MMKKIPFLTAIFSMAIAASSQAALLTSFSDNFNRADGAIGSNYTFARGGAFVISSNQLYQSSGSESITYLNLGTLPTALDYTNGFSYTAQVDLFIPLTGATTPFFGLALNYQDNSNYSGITFEGNGGNRRIRYLGRSAGSQQAPTGVSVSTLLVANPDSWWTLRVNSTSAGNYGYEFFLRSNESEKATGSFGPGGHATFTGGSIGFLTDTTPTSPSYLFDNFSVTVVPEPGSAALLGTGLLGLVGVRRLIRRRS